MMKNIRIGEMLKEYGYITNEQLEYAVGIRKAGASEKRLAEILIELNYITGHQYLKTLGRGLGLELVDLDIYHIQEMAVEKIPKTLALKYNVIAIDMDGSQLTIATNDPMNLYAIEDVRLITNMQVKVVLADRPAIERAIEIYYAEVDVRMAAATASQAVLMSGAFLDNMMAGGEDEQAPIVRLLDSLLIRGYNTNVSDIHIEPYEKETVVRMRTDGMLLPYMTLSPALHQGLVARTKILAQMDIAEKRKPQDGHFKTCLDGIEINIRVSFVPTIYGEKGVLRFLTTNTPIDHIGTFGMSEENYRKILAILKNPHGIIYLTGPTGSGKTTTLYSILQYMSNKPVNISTIEDPVEKNIPKINQIQVNELAGVTFDSGLRALLRQDPDIIMVGETRDYETASISARAAITGHLVFSTLHTNDAVSSAIRLQDMGLPAYMVAGSVVGIVAQRLVRKVCLHCGEEHEASEKEKRILFGGKADGRIVRIRRGRGCHICSETGYKGRVAVHEVLAVDAGIRRMISDGSSVDELRAYAVETLHMTLLRDEVRKLVLEGITTVEEMEKITYSLD